MMSWILRNKEWLFSGVGGLISVVFFRFLFRIIKQRRKGTLLSMPGKAIEGPLDKTDQACSLSALDIKSAIDEAPLLQKPEVAKRYIGLKVTWKGTLANVSNASEDLARVQVCAGELDDPPYVFAEVVQSQHPGLALLKYGHPVQISGVIFKLDSYTIHRNDAKLEYKL